MKKVENKKTKNRKITIYFNGRCKAEEGRGPAGTAAILQYVRPDGRESLKLIDSMHPQLTAPQAQMTAVIEGFQALKQEGLEIILVGHSADVEGWVTRHYQFGQKTKNKGLVRQLTSLIGKHHVTFRRPTAVDEYFPRCQTIAQEMAEEQQKKRFEAQALQIGLGANMPVQPETSKGVQHELAL